MKKILVFFLICISAIAYAGFGGMGSVENDGGGGGGLPIGLVILGIVGAAGYVAYQQGEQATIARRRLHEAHQRISELDNDILQIKKQNAKNNQLAMIVSSFYNGELSVDEFFESISPIFCDD